MRLVLPLLSGITIALALFWGMQYMISQDQKEILATDNLRMTEFVRSKRDSKIQNKDRLVPEKPKPKKRPTPPKIKTRHAQVSKIAVPDMAMPNLDIPLQKSSFGGSVLTGLQVGTGLGKISTNVIPLVRIPPTYPMRARNRNIKGWVKVEFTITKEGNVKDAKVIESEPSSIFNRAALKAIKRWKFKPHIIAGEASAQRAMQIMEFGN